MKRDLDNSFVLFAETVELVRGYGNSFETMTDTLEANVLLGMDTK